MSVKNSSGYAPAFPLPVGTTLPFAGVVLPTDWLWCDASPINQALYPDLYQQTSPYHATPSYNVGRFCMAGNSSGTIFVNPVASVDYSITLDAENIPSLPMTYVSSAWTAQLTNNGMTNGDEKNTNDDNGSKLQYYNDPSNHTSNAVTFDALAGWGVSYNGANTPIVGQTPPLTTAVLPNIAIKWIVKAR
jgi:hypothetical protein